MCYTVFATEHSVHIVADEGLEPRISMYSTGHPSCSLKTLKSSSIQSLSTLTRRRLTTSLSSTTPR